MSKFSKCPVCNKKGLYVTTGNFYRSLECRYCKSHWATHTWTMFGRGCKCSDCESLPKLDTIYPHFCPIPEKIVATRIAQEKDKFVAKEQL